MKKFIVAIVLSPIGVIEGNSLEQTLEIEANSLGELAQKIAQTKDLDFDYYVDWFGAENWEETLSDDLCEGDEEFLEGAELSMMLEEEYIALIKEIK